jgi:hypothetical protein
VSPDSQAARTEVLAKLIRTSIYAEPPLARPRKTDEKRGERRALVHARAATKALEPYESVRFVAMQERWGALLGPVLGDTLFLLTDRAIVTTSEPGIPITFLSRAKRYEYGQIDSVSVESAQFFGKASRLLVEFRDGWSSTFLLAPPGKSEEAAVLLRENLALA